MPPKKGVYFSKQAPFWFSKRQGGKTFEFNSTVFRFLLEHDFSFEIEWKCNSCAKWIHSTSYACRCKCKWYVVAHHNGQKIFIRKQSYFYKHLLHSNLSGKENLSLHQPFFSHMQPKTCVTFVTCWVTKGTDFLVTFEKKGLMQGYNLFRYLI